MLYTRKGDKGDTYFFDSEGERFSKGSWRAEALGALDEINSLLGVCKAKAGDTNIKINGHTLPDILEQVQQDLFIIQAAIAGADKQITQDKIDFVEGIIDSIEKELPEIKTFFLAGGSELSAFFDYARAVARRAERRVVRYSEIGEIEVKQEIHAYLNRLSSLLYALVRVVNLKSGAEEIPPNY
ncbi:MAG: cob(I)yrinic acid a,c-diamide adenosyltransferase [Candidatus Colwellbacteria bacterium]|nr:cob(I)yrinic acid a,c-diamide adenosyltransferase [Candidatus Colwellbacteria bacterium]